MKKFFLLCFILVLNLVVFIEIGKAYAKEPLLIPNKKTLYQRVICHPETYAYKTPDGQTENVLNAFTPLYVYGTANINNEEWIEVSPLSNTNDTLWVKKEKTTKWDKALSLTFTERMGRDPVMFFRSYEDLNELITSQDMSDRLHSLINSHNYNTNNFDSPLVALEPKDSAVSKKSFYLMPIIDYSLEYEQYGLKMLKVSCINPGTKISDTTKQQAVNAEPTAFKTGVAFIVDTTISMAPYIKKTKEFIQQTYNEIENHPLAEDLSFGVVAYRNSTDYDKNIEYVSKVISPFASVAGREQMKTNLQNLNEATVSTHTFNEDAFAGIMSAVEKLDWTPYAIKFAVLITDAGAIKNDDKFSSTKLNEEEIRDLLAQKGIRLLVMHLQTPAGKKFQLENQRQYQTLTSVKDANLKSVYLSLPADNAQIASQEFSILSGALVKIFLTVMEKTAKGELLQKPESTEPKTSDEKIVQIANCIGYAAQLDFIGNEQNTEAPHTVETWVVDKDLISLSNGKPTESLAVTVLLNKRQLDSLARQLQFIIDAAKSSKAIDSNQFFQRIVSLSAQTMRDPVKLQEGNSATTIAELGALPEFLEDLPYVSLIMSMTAEGWSALSSLEQDYKINELESKIKLYKEYHNDVENWVSFGSQDPAEAFYRVPLTSLP